MKLSLFDYYLPKSRIAQRPSSPRSASGLLVVDRKKTKLQHKHFYDLPALLRKGDVLVLNNTKVFPARLHGYRVDTGGMVEIFLLRQEAGASTWEVLVGNKKPRNGMEIIFPHSQMKGRLIGQIEASVWRMRFNRTGKVFWGVINRIGQTPLPPYLKQKELGSRNNELGKEYQTVYAKVQGSVAAPTAGLHFTEKLFNQLKRKGIQIEYLTLHVGLGTFQPVKVNQVEKHQMHAEWAGVDGATAKRLNQAKKEGRRIIAVGTTSVRTLESFSRVRANGRVSLLKAQQRWIQTFIYSGYEFKFVDAMITNFHLPKSTLLMLVSAFAGRTSVLKAYRAAIRAGYRFYSFGDAMLVL